MIFLYSLSKQNLLYYVKKFFLDQVEIFQLVTGIILTLNVFQIKQNQLMSPLLSQHRRV